MENLDLQIDKLSRDKLISLMQENQVRIGKFNIRYTKTNKKHTLDHWVACFDSYNKMLRSIPKDIIRIEREVRAKFVSTLVPERKSHILKMLDTELEVLYQKTEKLYRLEFEKYESAEEFTDRMKAVRVKCQEVIATQIKKTEEALNKESTVSGRMPAAEICELYELKESFLFELNLLEPLQNITLKFEQTKSDQALNDALGQVQQGIREMAKILMDEGVGHLETVKERKELKMRVARETLLFSDIVTNMEPLIDQLMLPKEQRNQEVMGKLWDRIEDFFIRGREDWKLIQPRFKSVYEVALSDAKN